MWRCILLVPFCAVMIGCGPSWVAEAGGKGSGYDVYRPEPYLLVVEAATTEHDGASAQSTTQPVSQQYTAKIIYLPDFATRYRIRSKSGGADIWIKDGWELSSLSDQNAAANTLAALAGAGSQTGQVGGDALSVLSLLGGQPISAQGSLYPGTSGGGGDSPLIQRGFALYKIIYNDQGHISGLVKVNPTDQSPVQASELSDHRPPAVPPACP